MSCEIPEAAGRCAGCAALAAGALGNKRLACVAVVDGGVELSAACNDTLYQHCLYKALMTQLHATLTH